MSQKTADKTLPSPSAYTGGQDGQSLVTYFPKTQKL